MTATLEQALIDSLVAQIEQRVSLSHFVVDREDELVKLSEERDQLTADIKTMKNERDSLRADLDFMRKKKLEAITDRNQTFQTMRAFHGFVEDYIKARSPRAKRDAKLTLLAGLQSVKAKIDAEIPF